jgi:hypothetical protein
VTKINDTHTPKRVVVKLGTGVLTHGVGQLDTERITAVCSEIAALRARGTEVIVVSSGAVGLGMGALKLERRPKELPKKQACAAIGQSRLMQTWQTGFAPHNLTVAQVLLTHDDLRVRSRYLGVQETLQQILAYGTIPIINENDTCARGTSACRRRSSRSSPTAPSRSSTKTTRSAPRRSSLATTIRFRPWSRASRTRITSSSSPPRPA